MLLHLAWASKRIKLEAQTTRVQLHKGDLQVSIRPRTDLSAQHGSPVKQFTGQPVLLSLWNFKVQRFIASECTGSGMRVEKHGQQWAPVSSTWQSQSMDGVLWDTLLSEVLGWFGGAPSSPALEATCKPDIPYSNTWYWSLMSGASLLQVLVLNKCSFYLLHYKELWPLLLHSVSALLLVL